MSSTMGLLASSSLGALPAAPSLGAQPAASAFGSLAAPSFGDMPAQSAFVPVPAAGAEMWSQLSAPEACCSDEDLEKLSWAVKRAENILKVGLAQVEVGRTSTNPMAQEHIGTLISKLRALDTFMNQGRRVCSFRITEGDWSVDFEGQYSLLSETTTQAELQTKLVKTLLASMRSAGAAAGI